MAAGPGGRPSRKADAPGRAGTATVAAVTTPRIPIEDLFADPARAQTRLSPDGRHLAWLAPLDGRMNVWVRALGGDEERPVTRDTARSISQYAWSRDGRILHLQDTAGDELTHLYVTDLSEEAPVTRDLTPFPGVKADLLDLPREAPGTAVVLLNRRDPTLFDVYRLTLDDGTLELDLENPGGAIAFACDARGHARVVQRQVEGGHHELLAREPGGELRVLRRFDRDDDGSPLAVTADGGGVLVRSAEDADVARLVRLDLATGEPEVLAGHPDVDVEGVLLGEADGRVLAVRYRTHGGVEWQAFDTALGQDLEALRAARAGDPLIASTDHAERRLVVVYEHDRDPGVTYLFDRGSGEAELLHRPYPALEPAHLAPREPVTITARDGLRLPSYLTRPLDGPGVHLPAVVLVHGGPWARDAWGWDPLAQLLANRGLAVLQVNYRGSTGFGKAFVAAAERQWAGAMHDDLLDAKAWLVEQGVADPERIGIAGGSYGGYAALVGAAMTPEEFACAYSIVGPSNLLTLLRSFPPYWRPMLANTFTRHIGDPDDPAAEEDLKARSPLFSARRIVRPLGITQTVNDPRVTKQESDQIVDALRKQGVDVDYLVIEGEGHGFANAENRLRAFAHMEDFLVRHLVDR